MEDIDGQTISVGDTVKCTYKVWEGTVTRVFTKDSRDYVLDQVQQSAGVLESGARVTLK